MWRNFTRNLSFFQVYPDQAHSLSSVRHHQCLAMEDFFLTCFNSIDSPSTSNLVDDPRSIQYYMPTAAESSQISYMSKINEEDVDSFMYVTEITTTDPNDSVLGKIEQVETWFDLNWCFIFLHDKIINLAWFTHLIPTSIFCDVCFYSNLALIFSTMLENQNGQLLEKEPS